MYRASLVVACAAGLGAVGSVSAAAIEVPLDPSQSSVLVELCVVGECDMDSSPITGSVTIELDSYNVPTQITLHDFNLALTDSIDLLIDC